MPEEKYFTDFLTEFANDTEKCSQATRQQLLSLEEEITNQDVDFIIPAAAWTAFWNWLTSS